MPKTFCLLNHELTQKQIAELNERFGSQEIVYPKEELSKLWAQILPEESNDKIIKEVVFWLEKNASPKDIFVISVLIAEKIRHRSGGAVQISAELPFGCCLISNLAMRRINVVYHMF